MIRVLGMRNKTRFNGVGHRDRSVVSNWALGLTLIALTVAVHAACIALLAVVTLSIRHRVEARNRIRVPHLFTVLTVLIGLIGVLLAALHGIEAALWAVAYVCADQRA